MNGSDHRCRPEDPCRGISKLLGMRVQESTRCCYFDLVRSWSWRRMVLDLQQKRSPCSWVVVHQYPWDIAHELETYSDKHWRRVLPCSKFVSLYDMADETASKYGDEESVGWHVGDVGKMCELRPRYQMLHDVLSNGASCRLRDRGHGKCQTRLRTPY